MKHRKHTVDAAGTGGEERFHILRRLKESFEKRKSNWTRSEVLGEGIQCCLLLMHGTNNDTS